jgi:hypothetical protein
VVRSDTAQSAGGGVFTNLFSSSGSSSSGGGVMDRMKSMVGLGGSTASEPAAPAPKSKPAPTKTAKTKPAEKKEPAKQTANANAGAIRPKSEPAAPQQQTASTQPPSPGQATINGAAPTVPTGSFDNRFGAWR